MGESISDLSRLFSVYHWFFEVFFYLFFDLIFSRPSGAPGDIAQMLGGFIYRQFLFFALLFNFFLVFKQITQIFLRISFLLIGRMP